MEIPSFRPLSLRDSITDSHERDLIQSPCLHSISVKTVPCDAFGKANYNRDAIFETVGLALNLQHANVVKADIAAAPYAEVTWERKRNPEKGSPYL